MATDTREVRELDSRRGGGIEVTLLWEPLSDRTFVAVTDERTGDWLAFPVGGGDAMEAFRHPHAHLRGDVDVYYSTRPLTTGRDDRGRRLRGCRPYPASGSESARTEGHGR